MLRQSPCPFRLSIRELPAQLPQALIRLAKVLLAYVQLKEETLFFAQPSPKPNLDVVPVFNIAFSLHIHAEERLEELPVKHRLAPLKDSVDTLSQPSELICQETVGPIASHSIAVEERNEDEQPIAAPAVIRNVVRNLVTKNVELDSPIVFPERRAHPRPPFFRSKPNLRDRQ